MTCAIGCAGELRFPIIRYRSARRLHFILRSHLEQRTFNTLPIGRFARVVRSALIGIATARRCHTETTAIRNVFFMMWETFQETNPESGRRIRRCDLSCHADDTIADFVRFRKIGKLSVVRGQLSVVSCQSSATPGPTSNRRMTSAAFALIERKQN